VVKSWSWNGHIYAILKNKKKIKVRPFQAIMDCEVIDDWLLDISIGCTIILFWWFISMVLLSREIYVMMEFLSIVLYSAYFNFGFCINACTICHFSPMSVLALLLYVYHSVNSSSHSVNGDIAIQWEWSTSTPHRIQTPQQITIKLCTIDYVHETNM